ncbi:MAG: hypothetical protein K9G67_02065 [Bacteroidales bacterium]|nr:hypothetical protein [Bacteroidales bacterium]MCF8349558.1 hypothetical protein [Bacteroidales bacterium]MCF8375117.1 hypothetical protein [Bacteroidales bacterium]MCF8400024.1 hypothetical protein [Bacteroidales bacterium]
MKHTKLLPVILMMALAMASCKQSKQVTYLGFQAPADSALLFGPGVFSGIYDEFNASFDEQNQKLFYTLRKGWFSFIILQRQLTNGEWSDPDIATFSGTYRDADPFISPDKSRLIFCSDRPMHKGDTRLDWNIWICERTEDGWGEPLPLDFNTDNKNEMYPTMSKNGNIYFHADYEGEEEPLDIMHTNIYVAKKINDDWTWADPEMVPSPVSTDRSPQWDPFISPDEDYIIFTAMLPGGIGGGDMYISFKRENGQWGVPENMGQKINSKALDYCPNLSPDGKYLFFSSYRTPPRPVGENTYDFLKSVEPGPKGRAGNIYWIDSSVIEDLRNR